MSNSYCHPICTNVTYLTMQSRKSGANGPLLTVVDLVDVRRRFLHTRNLFAAQSNLHSHLVSMNEIIVNMAKIIGYLAKERVAASLPPGDATNGVASIAADTQVQDDVAVGATRPQSANNVTGAVSGGSGVEATTQTESCPRCNCNLVVRKNRTDLSIFWGCSSFPMCRYTRNPM